MLALDEWVLSAVMLAAMVLAVRVMHGLPFFNRWLGTEADPSTTVAARSEARATTAAIDRGEHMTIVWTDCEGIILRSVGARTLRDWPEYVTGRRVHDEVMPVVRRAAKGETVQYTLDLEHDGSIIRYFGVASPTWDGRGNVSGVRFDVVLPVRPLHETEILTHPPDTSSNAGAKP